MFITDKICDWERPHFITSMRKKILTYWIHPLQKIYTVLLLSIAAVFLGYVLPWGQISFWAATVITNLLSAIPYIGIMIVEWVWGGYAVGNSTLTQFFVFHFVLSFVILFIVILIFFFHMRLDRIILQVLVEIVIRLLFILIIYRVKDIYGFGTFFIGICIFTPYIFMNPEFFFFRCLSYSCS